ncbi:hypothetical protein [Paenibacillus monticola]|uniref:Uncharacterized protein n=1 Tax=Paenibacillus monticola TaxID=2666075 RepID=A0A7X2L062_9BACL|nr:hypothetical protein [Paenibacillus monticola]MRN51969.1 hypothetical protein [Paenibacillus monticola]
MKKIGHLAKSLITETYTTGLRTSQQINGRGSWICSQSFTSGDKMILGGTAMCDCLQKIGEMYAEQCSNHGKRAAVRVKSSVLVEVAKPVKDGQDIRPAKHRNGYLAQMNYCPICGAALVEIRSKSMHTYVNWDMKGD